MTKNYHAFLLRIWHVDDPENSAWLSSLEDPHTRKIVGFSNLGQLYEFIRHLTVDFSEEAGREVLHSPDQENPG